MIPCSGCERFVFAEQTRCPFCGTRLFDTPAPRTGIGAAVILGAALSACGPESNADTGADTSTQTTQTSETMTSTSASTSASTMTDSTTTTEGDSSVEVGVAADPYAGPGFESSSTGPADSGTSAGDTDGTSTSSGDGSTAGTTGSGTDGTGQ